MGAVDNLAGNEALADLVRRVRRLENGTPLNNSSIGRGGLRIYNGGGITIENGGLSVTGSATISGVLEASGSINMSGTFTATGTVRLSGSTDIWGPLTVTGDTDLDGLTTINGDTTVTGQLNVTGNTTIAGDTTVTGDFNVNGPMKTTGTLDVEGVTTLKNDLNVTGSGKIKFGDMTIDPGLLGGSIQFNAGGYLSGTTSGPQLTGPAGNAFVYAYSARAGMQATDIRLTGAVEAQGTLKVTNPGTRTGVTPNVYIDTDGFIRKIT